jgi:DNA-binding NarL/FixJ family response regulator
MAVLVLSMLDDRASVQAAIDAGARGYLVKSSGLEDIIRGVHAVHSGQFLLGPTAHAQLLHTGRQEPAAFRSHRSEFTAREEQILDLLATGATTGHIADRLDISSKTVRNYLSILYAKLGVEDRGQAALAARALRDTRNDR